MFRYNLLTAFVILHAAQALSTGQDMFGLTDFSEPINSDSLQTSDSLFWAEIDDSAAGGLESFYPIEDLNVENTSQKFRLSQDQSSTSDASSPSSEENIFESSDHADLFDEGNTAVGDSISPPCEGNLIERSLNFARSPEELADSSVHDYCLPSKTQTPPPQLNLPKDLNDLDDLLNPKLSTPLLDPLLRVFPYRVLCPLIGDYTIVCCGSGSGSKRVKCLECKFLAITLIRFSSAPHWVSDTRANADDQDNPRCSQQEHVFCCFRFYVSSVLLD